MTLLQRIRLHAAARPAAPALRWPGGVLGYAPLLAEIERAMQLLEKRSVQVIALDLGNGPDWVVFDIAALALDICVVPLPPFFSPGQIRHAIQRAGVEAVVSDRPWMLREHAGGCLDRSTVLLPTGRQSAFWIATAAAAREGAAVLPAGIHKVTFTSGTTGAPKGVLLGWQGMREVSLALVDAVELGVDDRHLALMPLAVLLENIGGLYAPLWAGASVVLPPLQEIGVHGASGVDGIGVANALMQASASTAIFTPQTLQALIEDIESGAAARPPLRFAAVGGAPVSPRLLERAAAVDLPVYEGYGLSECGSVVCLNTVAARRPGSVGRPLPHVDLAIAADGEVTVRDSAFAGYLGEPPAIGRVWRTGDLGDLDDDGFLHLRGRRGNVFITAFGRNVAPEWVERELTLEPAIAQAAVSGEARPYNVAIIVPAHGATDDEIRVAVARANHDLPEYARVSRWTRAGEPFSTVNGLLTGTGRIRRAALQARYANDIRSLYPEAQTS